MILMMVKSAFSLSKFCEISRRLFLIDLSQCYCSKYITGQNDGPVQIYCVYVWQMTFAEPQEADTEDTEEINFNYI